jgi:tetratricopeptide (TPR) repeat protein
VFSRSTCVLLTFFAILAGSQSLAAQPKAPKLPAIADLDRAMGAERYADARQIADVLLQSGGAAEQATVSLNYGRILLGQNDKKAFSEYRKNVRQLKLKGPDATLIEVYDAWALALARPAETDAAVKTLEDILGKNENCDATAEAADVLAQLYLARGDTADAKRVVEAGLKQFTGYQPRKTGYIDQILKNRLKAKASPAQALYDAAEKLRHEKKFLEAGRVYTQVQTTYPKDALAQAAEFHIGECLVGLQRPVQALELWRKFLKESPGGAWRGQARVAVADLLMDQLDLTGATNEVRQAAAVLDNLRGAGSRERIAHGLKPHPTSVSGRALSRS